MTYIPDSPEDEAPAAATPAPAAGATGGAEPPRERWVAPARPVGRPMRRRRGGVRFLKVALPLVVVVTMGYLVYWWVQSRDSTVGPEIIQTTTGAENAKPEVTVNNVKYDGKDDQGRPYSVTAEAASHEDGDERHIALKKPLADITMSSGAYVAVTAIEGMLDRDSDIVILNGDVTLFHDSGMSFQTDTATIHLKDKTAEGAAPVEGQNGDGEIIAQGFKVLDDGDTIEFTGKAYMKIYPKNKGQDG